MQERSDRLGTRELDGSIVAARLTPVPIGNVAVEPYVSMDQLVRAVFPDKGGVRSGFGIAINAEKVVRALVDEELASTIAEATIRFADGAGIVWALRRRGFIVPRLTGVDFWLQLMRAAALRRASVYLLGGAPGVVDEVRDKLLSEFVGMQICGTQHGFFDSAHEQVLIETVRAAGPALVTVALGSPTQERLIQRMRAACPEPFYLGVGGTYDVYTGRVPRAPDFFQEHALEWLYRLIRQPSRWRRQTALARFAVLELSGKL